MSGVSSNGTVIAPAAASEVPAELKPKARCIDRVGAPPIRQAVLLGAPRGTARCPISHVRPRYLWPNADGCAASEVLRILAGWGIESVVLCCQHDRSQALVGELRGVAEELGIDFQYRPEMQPRGSAGAIRDAVDAQDNERVLIASLNMLVELSSGFGADITGLGDDTAAAVVLVKKSSDCLDRFEIDDHGAVRAVHLQSVSGSAPCLTSAGLWIFSGRAIRSIPRSTHQSIREQFLPTLVASGERVFAVEACRHPESEGESASRIDKYLAVCRNGSATSRIASSASVASGARICGDVVIGERSRIEGNVVLEGRCVIGADCVIGHGSVLQDSIVWDGVRVGTGTIISDSLLTDGAKVRSRGVVSRRVIVNRRASRVAMLNSMDHSDSNGLRVTLDSCRVGRMREQRRVSAFARAGVKRVFDVCFALLVLLVSAPVMLLAAILIKLESPGPILFRQKRCTKGGREFTMLKLRTMVADAERLQEQLKAQNEADGPMFKMKRDPRITRVGAVLRKSCLDEVPQMLNVLRGEMSIVGPRPLAAHEMTVNPAWRDLRLSVKPGVTGLWQVCGRDQQAFADWIRYDIEYVQNPTLWTDLRVLLRTGLIIIGCLRKERS